MRKLLSITLVAILFNSCTNGQTQNTTTNLSATEFSEKMKELPDATLLDVRTDEEYSKGHLINALNYDWNSSDFDKKTSLLDKSKPVFIYCLSGGRSSSAANKMRSDGFQQVYEMQGGIMKWRSANLPETTAAASTSKGMTKQQFNNLLKSEKLVLVDFYADWCGPCKKMKPYLEDISKDLVDKVVVIRINADDNQALCKELKIDELPVLLLYKNNTLSWTNTGFIDKAEIVKRLQ